MHFVTISFMINHDPCTVHATQVIGSENINFIILTIVDYNEGKAN